LHIIVVMHASFEH